MPSTEDVAGTLAHLDPLLALGFVAAFGALVVGLAWVRSRHVARLTDEIEAARPAPEDAEPLARALRWLPDGEALAETATASVVMLGAYRMLLDSRAVTHVAGGIVPGDAVPDHALQAFQTVPEAVGEALADSDPAAWAEPFQGEAGDALAAFDGDGLDPDHALTVADVAEAGSDVASDQLGDAMLSGLLYLPVGTLVMASARAVERSRAGVPTDRVLAYFREEVVCRGAGVVGGSAGLGILGGALGGPLGAAAGYVLGAFAGSLGGRAVGEKRKQARLVARLGAHRDALATLGTRLATDDAVFERFHRGIDAEVRQLGDNLAANEDALSRHLSLWRRLWPDRTTVRLRLAVETARTQLVRIKGPFEQLGHQLDALRHDDPIRLGTLVWQHPRLAALGAIPASFLAPVEATDLEVRTEIAALEGRPPPPRGDEGGGIVVPFPKAAAS